jgi:hypothetical protein
MGDFPPDTWADVTTAPEHVVDLLLRVMRPYPEHPDGPPPGTLEYMQAARAEARIYADRLWNEAAVAGAAFQLAIRQPSIRIEVTPSEMAELRKRASEIVQPCAVVPADHDRPSAAPAGEHAPGPCPPDPNEEPTP